MKNKMPLTRVIYTRVKALFVALSLCYAGVASAIAHVESRANATSSYSNQGSEGEQNAALNTMQRIEYLQREVQELRGKVEEQGYQLQQMQEQQKKLYTDLDKRLREGSSAAKTVAASTGDGALNTTGGDLNSASQFVTLDPEPAVTTQAASAISVTPVNDEKAYQAAYRLVQNRDFDGAIKAFNDMLVQNPKGKYAPNAQYWLGEINLTKGNLEKASESFYAVYSQHPKHPKAADSLLKLGYVEYNKGNFKKSQEFLNQVKAQFPGTTSAQLADSRLQRMQHEGHL